MPASNGSIAILRDELPRWRACILVAARCLPPPQTVKTANAPRLKTPTPTPTCLRRVQQIENRQGLAVTPRVSHFTLDPPAVSALYHQDRMLGDLIVGGHLPQRPQDLPDQRMDLLVELVAGLFMREALVPGHHHDRSAVVLLLAETLAL